MFPYAIVTGRFNNETRDRNYEYRKKYGYKCMYCVPQELSPKISYGLSVFVIEMNNSIDKIEGIGLMRNKPEFNKYYKVHTDGNTNRYTYIGKYFMERELIYRYNSKLVDILEVILFKGKTHSKRGLGLTCIPEKVLTFEICKGIDMKQEIKRLFIEYYNNDSCFNDDKFIEIKEIEKNNQINKEIN